MSELRGNYQDRSTGESRDRDATADQRAGPGTDPESLLVVSNRQPYRHKYAGADGTDRSDNITVDEPTGGLTAGLDPVLQRTNGTWIAWGDGEADREVTDQNDCVTVPPDDDAYTLRRLWLSEAAVEGYYYGFSNRVLWPLCHGLTDLVESNSSYMGWYRRINERFADAVVEHADADTAVWIQDYHFGLAPSLIRDQLPESVPIAQFWHIPWPRADIFEACPGGDHLLAGLLGNDLLTFHVDRYVSRFMDCVERFLPDAAVDRTQGTVTYEGTTTQLCAAAMGVDAEAYERRAQSIDESDIAALRETHDIPADGVVALGVDRLDYTKGIPHRLAAVERFLDRNPRWHGEFTFVQKATPSRTEIPAYQRLGERVRDQVERINRRFGTDSWQPIVYTEAYLSESELAALYREADLMLVSSLADGMNLVAQEYLAASVDETGALLLSDRTGAHDRLGSHAHSIDPTSIEDITTTIADALAEPIADRRRRMQTLRERVLEGDLEWWMQTQFDRIHQLQSGEEQIDERHEEQSFPV
ncbi:trehalose-6-phosphate synthase [Halobacteria archaeon AArc-dxtr1]|nr:trehalose-6-phosphate synthase [Halobacteria archaeon AArc-dxtr1]